MLELKTQLQHSNQDGQSINLLNEKTQKIVILEVELKDALQNKGKLTESIDELQNHLGAAKAMLSQLSVERENLIIGKKTQETKIEEQKEKIKQLSNDNDTLRKKQHELLNVLQQDKGYYLHTIHTLENILGDSHNILKSIQDENSQLKLEKSKLNQQMQVLIKQNKSLLSDVQDAGDTCNELQSLLKLASETFHRSTLSPSVSSAEPLSKKIEDLQSQLQTSRQRNNELENQLKIARKELRDYLDQEFIQDREKLQKEAISVQDEMNTIQKENLSLLQNVEQLQQAYSKLESTNTQSQEHIHQLDQ